MRSNSLGPKLRARTLPKLLALFPALAVAACEVSDGGNPDTADVTDAADTANNTDAADAADTADVTDAADTSDAADAPDTADAADAVDTAGTADTTDAVDASDTADAADTSDTADASDTADTADAADASDTADTADASDTADTADASDTGDTADTADTTDAADVWEPVPETFVRIEAGAFTRGSPEGELGRAGDEDERAVTLTRAFLLQSTEVTQGDFSTLMSAAPSRFSECGAGCPVETVTWFDAVRYANERSRADGLDACYDSDGTVIGGATIYDCEGYRLPTEAEWEYAARAGTTTATHGGNLTALWCDDTSLLPVAWFCANSDDRTHPVGQKAPNAWGLYDMYGNVAEWTHDWYVDYPSAGDDPSGPTGGTGRITRGGSYFSGAQEARAAARIAQTPDTRGATLGFRLARTAP